MYVTNQPLAIRKVLNIAATTTAQTVNIGSAFSIQNAGANAVYFTEKGSDLSGPDATAANGFAIPANTTVPFTLCAQNLSIVSATGGSTVNILLLDLV